MSRVTAAQISRAIQSPLRCVLHHAIQLSHLAWVVRNEWKPVLCVLTWLDIIWSLYGNIALRLQHRINSHSKLNYKRVINIARTVCSTTDPSAKPLKLHLSKVVLVHRTTPIVIRSSSSERRTPIWKDAQCHAVP
jgi:hypothetical protein